MIITNMKRVKINTKIVFAFLNYELDRPLPEWKTRKAQV